MGEHAVAVVPPADADAPGELGVVEAFVNTVTYNWDDPSEETLTDPASVDTWLVQHGLLAEPGHVTQDEELERVVALREALRELLYANHDAIAPPEQALDVLRDASRGAPLEVAFGDDGTAWLSAHRTGLDSALATILAIMLRAMHEGTWRRLKACRNDGCRYAFYDRSRNRSGRWCDMAVCGNRAKVRAFRERQREQ